MDYREALVTPNTLRIIHSNFMQELSLAHAGHNNGSENTTSLPYIVSQLPSSPVVRDGEKFDAIVIGGTTGLSAVLEKSPTGNTIINQRPELPLPRFETGADIANYLIDLTGPNSRIVALNFAYPLEPDFSSGVLDGKLVRIDKSKAVVAQDLIGRNVGQVLSRIIKDKTGRELTVSVGNDGVCLATSGLKLRNPDEIGFGIVGTGVNFGFFIDPNKVVNLESAEFDRFPQSDVGKKLTGTFGSPFGKETNGASLYRHYNALIEAGIIQGPLLSSTFELSQLASGGGESSIHARRIIDRAGKLVACQVAGIADFKGTDLTFVIEGSVFWKATGYKEAVESEVKELTTRRIDFIEVPNSQIVGAVKLVS